MAKKGTLFGKPRGEVIKHPGAFSEKAERAGKSTAAYARQVSKPGSRASTETKKQAGLAKAFATMRRIKSGKAKFLVPLVLAGFLGVAHAATVPCPSGWLIGPTAQTTTGAGPNTITPRGNASIMVEGILTAGTATMQVEICCAPANCVAGGPWAPVMTTPMSLALATPAIAFQIMSPMCVYRANVTACSSCSVTALVHCG